MTPSPAPVFLSLGSNIKPEKHIPECLAMLRQTFRVLAVSSVYETPPFGPAGEKKFWNAAVLLESDLPPADLQERLAAIEAGLGRSRTQENSYAPRTIDLDLLPKPGYQKQAFVMVPLAEIAPDFIDAETGKSFAALAEKLADQARSFRKFNP